MNKLTRFASFLTFLAPALWMLPSSFAQSPFDGTWRANLDQSKLSPRPTVVTLSNGIYICESCAPKIHVKADGQDQPVTGQAYDTMSVREVDPKTIALTYKKGGKTGEEVTRTVSDDGTTLTAKVVIYPADGQPPVKEEATYTRVGKAPDGAHAVSGSFRINKLSASAVNHTYRVNGDELSYSDGFGESYTAKFDGKDYPFKGAYGRDETVSLKRIDDHTIEETVKRDGKTIEVTRMNVSPDGKKLTWAETNKLSGATSTIILEKQ
jgi:hypothetical protein